MGPTIWSTSRESGARAFFFGPVAGPVYGFFLKDEVYESRKKVGGRVRGGRRWWRRQ